MRHRISVALATIAGLIVVGPIGSVAQEAPFGIAWGRDFKVPRPSLAQREENITALIYLGERLPPAMKDTEELVLEVCASEGLQRMVWVSRDYAPNDAQAKYKTILDEGTRRFGKPEPDQSGRGAFWSNGRSTLALGPGASGADRIVMTSFGPGFDACSSEHLASTGHPATEHTADMWVSR